MVVADLLIGLSFYAVNSVVHCNSLVFSLGWFIAVVRCLCWTCL